MQSQAGVLNGFIRRDLLYNIGLIDEKDREYFKKVAKMVTDAIKAKKYTAALQLFDELLNGDLSGHPSYLYNVTGFKNYFNYAITELPKSFDFYADYVQVGCLSSLQSVGLPLVSITPSDIVLLPQLSALRSIGREGRKINRK